MIVDAHAHLEDPRFDLDRDDVIRRAWDNYVRCILTIHSANEKDRWEITRQIIESYSHLYAAAALHPHDSSFFDDSLADSLHSCWKHEKVIAIGETGLDFYYMHSPRERQLDVFAWHINQARVHKKPLVIHTRDAHEETLDLLWKEHADEIGGIIHCFNGDVNVARRYLDLNFLLSFSGILTYPNADEVKEVATYVPLERILVETDCPYLTPVPYRGRRNEPAYVLKVAEFIAKMRRLNIGDVKNAITQNFSSLFSINLPSPSPLSQRVQPI